VKDAHCNDPHPDPSGRNGTIRIRRHGPAPREVGLDAYQAPVIRIQYAFPVGWAPEVEYEMVDENCKVVTKMTGKNPDRMRR
jgi:hypothetical protein